MAHQARAQTNPLQVFRSMLEGKMRAEIAKALPKDIDPDRFIRMVVTAVQMNPDLLEADRRSLFAACMRAASALAVLATRAKSQKAQATLETLRDELRAIIPEGVHHV